ncbi:MAG: hypothetical protein JF603_07375 [Acidobacteria bacterium]|nr:hypothetical protein [Acidobacteriota bacterium]
MLDHDVEQRLAALGGRRPPAPRGRFVDELGERLVSGSPVPSRRRRVSRLLSPVLSAAAGVLITVLVMSGQDDGAQTVQMFQTAGSVEVVLPDGSVVPGVAGMTVPDGSLIRVRGAGHAVVDGVIVGPGEEAEVVGGDVQPTGVPEPTTTVAPPTTAAAPPTTATPVSTPPSAAARPTTTAAPTTSTTTPPSTTTTPPREVQPMRLQARYNDRGQVVLRWSGYTGPPAAFGSYVVLRAPAPNRPDRPGENGTRIVGRATDQQRLFGVDSPPPDMRPVYRVVALDPSNRRVIASTFAVQPDGAQTSTQSGPTESQPATTSARTQTFSSPAPSGYSQPPTPTAPRSPSAVR